MRLIDADIFDAIVNDDGTIDENATETVKNAMLAIPAVDAVPVRHGKWIYGNEFHWYTASCNQCGYKRYTDIKAAKWNAWKYCPNCGARMDGE